MIKPKVFYRELDLILSKIRKEKSHDNFFFTILSEIHDKFGKSLNILNSHIYEKRGDDYVLVDSINQNSTGIKERIPINSETIKQISKNGCMIYDKLFYIKDFDFGVDYENITPAAIHVHTPVKRWIFLFELSMGWSYEETTLFLNALRTALNYRLFSQMMNTDIKRAEQIQKSLLPREAPHFKGFDAYGYSQPAEYVGGDFFEYFYFSKDNFGVSLGDASGHGLPAALLVRDVVVGLRMGLTEEMRLVHTIKKLNKVIQKSTYATNFVSLFVGEIENGNHLFYVNAGHPPPFVVLGDKVDTLEATGITLGFLPEIELERNFLLLEKNSILVLYTDGLIERQGDSDEQFGEKRLQQTVIKNQNKSAKELVQLIFREVFEFGNQKNWNDDVTLVIMKRVE
ncbi:MAG: PP2C family protein-serine/threonine phosphatase [bacterium]